MHLRGLPNAADYRPTGSPRSMRGEEIYRTPVGTTLMLLNGDPLISFVLTIRVFVGVQAGEL